jgi:hypothetical protein
LPDANLTRHIYTQTPSDSHFSHVHWEDLPNHLAGARQNSILIASYATPWPVDNEDELDGNDT